MQLDKELISRLEKLARLQLSDPEREKLTSDLQSMLDMVDKLRELDTTGVEPLIYLNDQGNVSIDYRFPFLHPIGHREGCGCSLIRS